MSLRDETMSRFGDNREPIRISKDAAKQIARHREEFLANGGVIQKIPPGVSTYEPGAYFQIHGKEDAVINMNNRPHPSKKRANNNVEQQEDQATGKPNSVAGNQLGADDPQIR